MRCAGRGGRRGRRSRNGAGCTASHAASARRPGCSASRRCSSVVPVRWSPTMKIGARDGLLRDLGVEVAQRRDAQAHRERAQQQLAHHEAPDRVQSRLGLDRGEQPPQRLAEGLVAEEVEARLPARGGDERALAERRLEAGARRERGRRGSRARWPAGGADARSSARSRGSSRAQLGELHDARRGSGMLLRADPAPAHRARRVPGRLDPVRHARDRGAPPRRAPSRRARSCAVCLFTWMRK